jgi:hypothetical protein
MLLFMVFLNVIGDSTISLADCVANFWKDVARAPDYDCKKCRARTNATTTKVLHGYTATLSLSFIRLLPLFIFVIISVLFSQKLFCLFMYLLIQSLESHPDELLFQIQRCQYNSTGNSSSSPYTGGDNRFHRIETHIELAENVMVAGEPYELHGVMVHRGSAQGGHCM